MSLPNTTPDAAGCNNWMEAVSTPDQLAPGERARRLDGHQQHARDAALHAGHLEVATTNLWGDDPFPVVSSIWNQPGKILVAQLNKNIGSTMVNSLTFSYSMNTIEVTRGGDESRAGHPARRRHPHAVPVRHQAARRRRAAHGQLGLAGRLRRRRPLEPGALAEQPGPVRGEGRLLGRLRQALRQGRRAGQLQQEERGAQQHLAGVGAGQRRARASSGPNGYRARASSTGNTIANWLLAGMVWNTSELRTNPNVQQRWKDFEVYIADSYKVNSRVTADFGVRLTHFTAPYVANDRMASFDPGTINPALGNSPCNGLLYVPGTNPCPALGLRGRHATGRTARCGRRRPSSSRRASASPGTSSATGKTAVRGGLGLFYARERAEPGPGPRDRTRPSPAPPSVDRTLDSNQVVTGQTGLVVRRRRAAGSSRRTANPHNWQWNLSVQHELRPQHDPRGGLRRQQGRRPPRQYQPRTRSLRRTASPTRGPATRRCGR